MKNKNSIILRQYTQEAIDAANMAIKTSLPYVKNELKGTWIRPTELTKEQIIATLDKIEDAGFNNIFFRKLTFTEKLFSRVKQ